MLVTMPSVKEELKSALNTIDKLEYQIEELQKDLHLMFRRLKEFDGQTSHTE